MGQKKLPKARGNCGNTSYAPCSTSKRKGSFLKPSDPPGRRLSRISRFYAHVFPIRPWLASFSLLTLSGGESRDSSGKSPRQLRPPVSAGRTAELKRSNKSSQNPLDIHEIRSEEHTSELQSRQY